MPKLLPLLPHFLLQALEISRHEPCIPVDDCDDVTDNGDAVCEYRLLALLDDHGAFDDKAEPTRCSARSNAVESSQASAASSSSSQSDAAIDDSDLELSTDSDIVTISKSELR